MYLQLFYKVRLELSYISHWPLPLVAPVEVDDGETIASLKWLQAQTHHGIL